MSAHEASLRPPVRLSVEGPLLLPESREGLQLARELGRTRVLESGDRLEEAGGPPSLCFVSTGLVRVIVESHSGQQMTVLYGRPGALVGLPAVVAPAAIATVEAMVRTEVIDVPIQHARRLASEHPEYALEIAGGLVLTIAQGLKEVAAVAFADLRTRLARHLLALAQWDNQTRSYEAKITQAELAAAVASSEDAVGRVLRKMAREGLITTRPVRVQLRQPEGLLAMSVQY
jgi:CRP-like cAMP-binding protein